MDEQQKQNALIQAQQVAKTLDGAKASTSRLISALETGFKAPLNAPSSALQHRAEHRMGVPSRLDTDPELQAFVLARIELMTYKQVVAEVAASFPPDRRTSVSAVQRWWRKRQPQSPTISRS